MNSPLKFGKDRRCEYPNCSAKAEYALHCGSKTDTSEPVHIFWVCGEHSDANKVYTTAYEILSARKR